MLSNTFSPIEHRTLARTVEAALRKAILRGQILPGDRLRETELAEQFGMSRGPVREALAQLESEGLVRHLPHRGTFATTLSHSDAKEIYTLRALLEGEAAATLAPSITDNHLSALRQCITNFAKAQEQDDPEHLIEADIALHGMVCELSGLRRLTKMCEDLNTLVGACYLTVFTNLPERKPGIVDAHRDLIESLATHDAELARAAFSHHYLESWEALAAVLPR